MSNSDIGAMIDQYDGYSKEFKENLFRISWYMRGGVSINDLLYTYSYEDREIMSKIIKDNIDLTKETRMPLL
jgi:hypothetical protein